MEAQEINYWIAIPYALLGWAVRVCWYYFKYDKDTTSFDLRDWWRIYDKYIVLGFISCVALAFLSDLLWPIVDAWVSLDGSPFDERVNIVIGFLAIGILMFFDKKATSKE